MLEHWIIGWIHFASEFVPQDFWHFIPEVSQAVLSGCEAVLREYEDEQNFLNQDQEISQAFLIRFEAVLSRCEDKLNL